MKIVKMIVNWIIALLLTILIIANFVIILLSKTILSREYAMTMLEENGYYEKIETDIQNGFEEYRYQSGLPEEVFDNLYSSDMIRTDIEAMIDNLYDGTEITNSAENVRIKIAENINQYLKENGIVLKEEQQKNIDDFEQIIVDVYENKTNVISKYLNEISNVIEKINNIIITLKKTLMVGLILVCVFTLLLNINARLNIVKTIGISLLASGMILELGKWVIYKNIDINHILLITQSFSELIKYMIYNILSKFNLYGILFIVMGISSIVISNYYQIKRK